MTLLEAMVVVAIMAILAATAMPSLSSWVLARRVTGTAEFYHEGLITARNEALSHNSASRLVLVANEKSYQYDWRVDICYPSAARVCDNDAANVANWSTETAAAPGSVDGDNGYHSRVRSADSLPDRSVLQVSTNDGVTAVYFTPTGWKNAVLTPQISTIVIGPPPLRDNGVHTMNVKITLGGGATVCDPAVGNSEAVHGCPQVGDSTETTEASS